MLFKGATFPAEVALLKARVTWSVCDAPYRDDDRDAGAGELRVRAGGVGMGQGAGVWGWGKGASHSNWRRY